MEHPFNLGSRPKRPVFVETNPGIKAMIKYIEASSKKGAVLSIKALGDKKYIGVAKIGNDFLKFSLTLGKPDASITILGPSATVLVKDG